MKYQYAEYQIIELVLFLVSFGGKKHKKLIFGGHCSPLGILPSAVARLPASGVTDLGLDSPGSFALGCSLSFLAKECLFSPAIHKVSWAPGFVGKDQQ